MQRFFFFWLLATGSWLLRPYHHPRMDEQSTETIEGTDRPRGGPVDLHGSAEAIGEQLEDRSAGEAALLLEELTPANAAAVAEALDPKTAAAIVSKMHTRQAADLITVMQRAEAG